MNTYDARAALDAAAVSRTAARPRPVAAWMPPAVGLGFALGLSALGAADSVHANQWVWRAAGILLVIAAVVVPLVAARRSGVMSWTGGADRAERWKNTAPVTLAVLVALLVDLATDGPWFFIVLGCGLGAAAWARLARADKV